MNYDWIKVNRARNGFVLTWPEVLGDGSTQLEHRVIEAKVDDDTSGLRDVLEAVLSRFSPGLSWEDIVESR